MRRIAPLILLLLSSAYAPLQAQKYFGETGFAEFESRAPALTFTGVSNNLAGLIDLQTGMVDFYLDLTTLDTGIALRNRHMRDSYLNTRNFPFAEFTGTFQFNEPAVDTLLQPRPVTATGVFTIHGISRDRQVEGTVQFTGDGTGLVLEASFEVALEDHNIDRPRVVFYELSDIQRVRIRIEMEQYDE
ncbi:MAG: hypothetical protein HLUCCA01_11010 [Bacteroidetes bacterium HLUCCA01]|nr:MAG: hypothetical protein HLUCCA01_11010 [Bacteroidetes bacterium HLUCCA01]